MFLGEYSPVLDDKGRVAIPTKLRKAFGDDTINSFVLAPGFDRCIMAFRKSEWKKFVQENVNVLSQSDPQNRLKKRFLFSSATICNLDGQGRILIPAKLLKYAAIDRKLSVIGVNDRIEIWSEEKYRDYCPAEDEYESFAAELGF